MRVGNWGTCPKHPLRTAPAATASLVPTAESTDTGCYTSSPASMANGFISSSKLARVPPKVECVMLDCFSWGIFVCFFFKAVLEP